MKTKLAAAALLAATLPALQACFPVVAATGVAVGALAMSDRRSVGTQTDDETIEWKASTRVGDKYKDQVHVNITSYNRRALITGEVPNEQAKADIGEIVSKTENVRGVWNELQVGTVSSLSNRSNDTYVTSKVKARFVDASQFPANRVKVVTEAGVVYLLGIVNEREAKAAIQLTRTTEGVRKVVNVMEALPDPEIRRIDAAIAGQPPANNGKQAATSGSD